MTEKRGAENHPGSTEVPTKRAAEKGQFLHEEGDRGRIHGAIVMPDEPSFSQPKNGVTTPQTGERLTFETDVAAKEIRRGNRDSVDAGY
jgi:hypothetical protein